MSADVLMSGNEKGSAELKATSVDKNRSDAFILIWV